MSSQITTAFVQQYSANIQMLSQQMGSLLRDKVRVESVVGKNAFFDQVGSVTAQLKVSRQFLDLKSFRLEVYSFWSVGFLRIVLLITPYINFKKNTRG